MFRCYIVFEFFFQSSITNFLFMIMSLMLFCVFSLWFCLVVTFTLLLISTHSENLIHLDLMVQKFKNLVPRLRGPPFWYPQLCQILSLQNIMCLASVFFLASPFLGKSPHFGNPKFYLFFILTYAENFTCLAWVFKKFQFRQPCLWGKPIFGTLKFFQILSLPYVYFTLTIHVSSSKG